MARPLVASSLLVGLAALMLSGDARGDQRAALLDVVASVYSLGVGEIRCPSKTQWDADFASSFGHAYTNIRDEYTVLAPGVCAGALGIGDSAVPAWQQAVGTLVLVHESFHLRRWRHRRDEGKVECQAMTYFTEAAMRLGASAEQAQLLYPYALAFHERLLRTFPGYRERTCRVPLWRPPDGF